MIKIPLIDIGNQSFKVSLSGKVYSVLVSKNTRGPYEITIQDGAITLVDGLPMLSGIDLFSPFAEFNLQGYVVLNAVSINEDSIDTLPLLFNIQ